MKKYGNPPKIIGEFTPNFSEMCAYLYLPIKLSNVGLIALPKRLEPFREMIKSCLKDYRDVLGREKYSKYIYISVKNLWVQPGSAGNREGWHVDGWGSDGDINYIWCDHNPTEFAVQDFIDIPNDDRLSMVAMSEQSHNKTTYGKNKLLRLDESVVHRVGPVVRTGMRCFFKLSISSHKYDLVGNSHNYDLDYNWGLSQRDINRNVDAKSVA